MSQVFKEYYEDERPSKNYPQKLTTQRQKSFESPLSLTLMRVQACYRNIIELVLREGLYTRDCDETSECEPASICYKQPGHVP